MTFIGWILGPQILGDLLHTHIVCLRDTFHHASRVGAGFRGQNFGTHHCWYYLTKSKVIYQIPSKELQGSTMPHKTRQQSPRTLSFWAPFICSHGLTQSNQILHSNHTRWWEDFQHPPCLRPYAQGSICQKIWGNPLHGPTLTVCVWLSVCLSLSLSLSLSLCRYTSFTCTNYVLNSSHLWWSYWNHGSASHLVTVKHLPGNAGILTSYKYDNSLIYSVQNARPKYVYRSWVAQVLLSMVCWSVLLCQMFHKKAWLINNLLQRRHNNLSSMQKNMHRK